MIDPDVWAEWQESRRGVLAGRDRLAHNVAVGLLILGHDPYNVMLLGMIEQARQLIEASNRQLDSMDRVRAWVEAADVPRIIQA